MHPAHHEPEHPMKTLRVTLHRCAAAAIAALAMQAHADAFYTGIGTPGLMVGYAKSLSSTLTLRGDLASLPGVSRDSIEQGVSYTGTIKSDRGALFMDWYLSGATRLTGGMTFNHMRMDLRANGNGGAVIIGDHTYTSAPSDRFDVSIRYPSATPYLGMGYGRHTQYGSAVVFDIGASIGRPNLSETHSGPNLGNVSQADLDKELEQLRDGVGGLRFVPQVSLGVNVRF
jgi:hypothetical protein